MCVTLFYAVCYCPCYCNAAHSKKAPVAAVLFQCKAHTHCMASPPASTSLPYFFFWASWCGQQSSKIKPSWTYYIVVPDLFLTTVNTGGKKNNEKGTLSEASRKNYFFKEKTGLQWNSLLVLLVSAGHSSWPLSFLLICLRSSVLSLESRLSFFWRNQLCLSWTSWCVC